MWPDVPALGRGYADHGPDPAPPVANLTPVGSAKAPGNLCTRIIRDFVEADHSARGLYTAEPKHRPLAFGPKGQPLAAPAPSRPDDQRWAGKGPRPIRSTPAVGRRTSTCEAGMAPKGGTERDGGSGAPRQPHGREAHLSEPPPKGNRLKRPGPSAAAGGLRSVEDAAGWKTASLQVPGIAAISWRCAGRM